MRVWLLAFYHIQSGTKQTKTASYLKVSRRIVNEWVKRFNEEGIEGLIEKSRAGRPTKLDTEQLVKFQEYAQSYSIKESKGRLKAIDFVNSIESEFGIKYSKTNIYRLLHKLNFPWITTRSRHPKQSQEAQDSFKKINNWNDFKDPWG